MKTAMINGIVSATLVGVLLSLAKICFSGMSVILFMLIVLGGTHLTLLAILLVRREGRQVLSAGKRYPELYLVGVLGTTLRLLQNWGLDLSSPVNAAILLRGDLLFSLIIGYLLWKQKLRRLEWAGMGTMLVGVTLVLQISWQRFRLGSGGNILFLGSAFLVAVNAEIIKHRLGQVENMIVAYFNSGMSLILFLSGAAWTGELGAFPRAGMLIWVLVFTSIIFQVIQYRCYYRSLEGLPTWLVRVVHLITPIIAMVTSAWWLHERINMAQILGMLVVAGGITLIYGAHAKSYS
ncbi:EamA domain protein [Acididesulfobacillus acetoxydans]|uniref:Drug/metabolite transporter n=4 Tax=Acididesulfobacillus acetoxydans TaxID=1561005 RepID=A0A8S0W2L4_9FIRM|nr:DMT family transporter [Acididesulfobacillus acetoxydans]CAA7600758.1 EamA domain protein [Acididesulfobacillus acetoxydans]CAA7603319.1 EamA domain protein [Acididesulfobacillus acetoxydans]CEJ07169.1 Drug/metabolite transporter [Acididesulfobacillus acetoxydans]